MAKYKRNLASAQRQRAIRRARIQRVRRYVIRALGLVAVLAAFGGAAKVFAHVTSGSSHSAKPAAPSKARAVTIDCSSSALGGKLPARIYLPVGYDNTKGRWPVVYFLHGLPANPTSFESNGFVAAAVASIRQPAIVVAPQGSRTTRGDREYLDWGSDENWPRAISHDLVRCVDRKFRTIANRDGRALMGLAAGGYAALNIGLRSLGVYGAIESWSGYLAATDSAGNEPLQLNSAQAQAAATVPPIATLEPELVDYPTFVGFYVGDQDTRFLTDNQILDNQLDQVGVPHTFDVYPGGHTKALWRQEASLWTGYALAYLAKARQSAAASAGGVGAGDAAVAAGVAAATQAGSRSSGGLTVKAGGASAQSSTIPGVSITPGGASAESSTSPGTG